MAKQIQYDFMECLRRAECMGMYFVECSNVNLLGYKNLYDVFDAFGNWVCFHCDLPAYFSRLDGVEI